MRNSDCCQTHRRKAGLMSSLLKFIKSASLRRTARPNVQQESWRKIFKESRSFSPHSINDSSGFTSRDRNTETKDPQTEWKSSPKCSETKLKICQKRRNQSKGTCATLSLDVSENKVTSWNPAHNHVLANKTSETRMKQVCCFFFILFTILPLILSKIRNRKSKKAYVNVTEIVTRYCKGLLLQKK